MDAPKKGDVIEYRGIGFSPYWRRAVVSDVLHGDVPVIVDPKYKGELALRPTDYEWRRA